MTDHLKLGAEQTHRSGRRSGQQDISHVPNGAISHHPLHVGLGDGRQRSIQHGHGGPEGQPGGQHSPGLGKETQAEPQQAVGPELEQDPRQQYGHGGGGLGVGVRQPAMEGNKRNLDSEAHQEGTEEQQLLPHGQPFRQHRCQAEINRSGEEGKSQKGPQDQHP